MTSGAKSQNLPLDYELLDSGNLQKLERFGEEVLARPASQAIWTPQFPELWQRASKPKKPWTIHLGQDLKMKLRLQDNGQVGIFPEHYTYLSDLKISQEATVLNLFAYTGMASIYAASLGANVTHVELSKKCLDWAQENINLNNLPENSIRFIKEDVLSFLKKEIKRQKKYDLIICDPPSFSRPSKQDSWQLEDVLKDLVSMLAELAAPEGEIVFTSHSQQFPASTVENLFWEEMRSKVSYRSLELSLPESKTTRRITAGYLIGIIPLTNTLKT